MVTEWVRSHPTASVQSDEPNPQDADVQRLSDMPYRKIGEEHLDGLYDALSPPQMYYKPSKLLSKEFQLGNGCFENKFGSYVIERFSHLFYSGTNSLSSDVLKSIYIGSVKNRKSADVIADMIDDIVNRSKAPAIASRNIKADKTKTKQNLLVVSGDAGAGKSTFFDYFKDNYLTNDIAESICWCKIDMLGIDLEDDSLINKVLAECCSKLIDLNSHVNIHDISFLEMLFAREWGIFVKSNSARNPDNSYDDYKVGFFGKLLEDKQILFNNLIRFLFESSGKTTVFILDNIDGHVAKALPSVSDALKFLGAVPNSLAILSLRSLTLDFIGKSENIDIASMQVLTIRAPSFFDAIQARLGRCLIEMSEDDDLPNSSVSNGINTPINANHTMLYLNCIYNSCFDNKHYSGLLMQIIGSNIRQGISVFSDCCVSGHLSKKQINKMFTVGSDYYLPNHTVIKVIAKPRSQSYVDELSPIKSLFHAYEYFGVPDSFIRISILLFLQRNQQSPPLLTPMLDDLCKLGHIKEVVRQELTSLERFRCLSLRYDTKKMDYIVSVEALGIAHLDMLKDLSYISMISEDILFEKNSIANIIARNMMGTGDYLKDSPDAELNNCYLLVEYLLESHSQLFKGRKPGLVVQRIESLQSFVEMKISASSTYNGGNDELVAYPEGTEIVVNITSVQSYGLFVGFDEKLQGLIHKSNIISEAYDSGAFKVGDRVRAKVLSFSKKHRRFSLQFLD